MHAKDRNMGTNILTVDDDKLAREELRTSEQKYRLLIEHIPGFVYRGHKDWSVDFIDNKVGELTGYDKQEFDARRLKWSDLIIKEDIETAKKSVAEAIETGNSYIREYRIKTKTNKILWMQDRGQIITNQTGAIEYFSGVFFDITKQKQAEEKLQQIESHLVQSEKLSALGELTAGVSHELNQPLNGIKIISQALLRDIKKNRLEEEELEEDLTEIVKQVNKMAEIINHMRIYTRNTEGNSSEMIDISTVIEGPFKILDQQLKTHGIEVVKEFAPGLPEVMCDPIRLEQVFMNLIANAKGSVESCGKENKRIEIRAYESDDSQSVEVTVKDNGEGIPEHLRQKIFQPFFTTKEPGKGTGLGLSVSHKIIEEHRGRIELESKVGEGTTFKVILPTGG